MMMSRLRATVIREMEYSIMVTVWGQGGKGFMQEVFGNCGKQSWALSSTSICRDLQISKWVIYGFGRC